MEVAGKLRALRDELKLRAKAERNVLAVRGSHDTPGFEACVRAEMEKLRAPRHDDGDGLAMSEPREVTALYYDLCKNPVLATQISSKAVGEIAHMLYALGYRKSQVDRVVERVPFSTELSD